VPLTAGVLIIGSLLWDSEKGRPAWRDARLDVASAQAVTAPIRYGRKARTRGNSFTMVFSRQCPAGLAKLVPCSHTISTPQDLITEAEYLWKAEKPDAELHRIASRWAVSRRTHSDVSCEVLNEYDLLRRIGRPTTKENRDAALRLGFI